MGVDGAALGRAATNHFIRIGCANAKLRWNLLPFSASAYPFVASALPVICNRSPTALRIFINPLHSLPMLCQALPNCFAMSTLLHLTTWILCAQGEPYSPWPRVTCPS